MLQFTRVAGAVSREKKAEDAYDFPVLIIHQTPDKPKKEYQFELNSKAQDLLPESRQVTFFVDFIEDQKLHLGFVGDQCTVRGNGKFSDKKLHTFLNEEYNWIDTTDAPLVCKLVAVPSEFTCFEVQALSVETPVDEPVEDTLEDEVLEEMEEEFDPFN
jgi:hypothetical protein